MANFLDDPFLQKPGFTINTAKLVQDQLKDLISISPFIDRINYIAGADVTYIPQNKLAIAGIAIFEYGSHEPIELCLAQEINEVPYIPGYLSFREGPVVLKAFQHLQHKPDIIIFDGQGIAHPRGIGLASHFGVVLNLPTIGCAKTRLIGDFREPSILKGNFTDLSIKGVIVGVVYRSRTNVKPLFISPGHLTDIQSSIQIIESCLSKFRLPTPTRIAHQIVTEARKNLLS